MRFGVHGEHGEILRGGFPGDRCRLTGVFRSILFFAPIVLLVYWVRGALPPFALAAFLSFVLEPGVTALERRGNPRIRSILAVYGLALIIFLIVCVCFLPRFVSDLRRLGDEIPGLVGTLQSYFQMVRQAASGQTLLPGLERGVLGFLDQTEVFMETIGENIQDYFLSSARLVSYACVSPVIAYYILRDMNRWRKRSFVFLAKYPLPFVDLLRDIDQVLGGFVRGQSIVAASVMAMVWAASSILKLEYGAIFGFISGLGEFVPFFGPVVGAVPFLMAALMKSAATFLWALGFVAFIQWFDSSIIVPRVTGPRVGLHPLWIIFALFAGKEILGTWGIFLAVPLAGVTRVVLRFVKAMEGKWGRGFPGGSGESRNQGDPEEGVR